MEAKHTLKRTHRNRLRPHKLRELPEGTPVEIARAAGFVVAARKTCVPSMPKIAHQRRFYPPAVKQAATDEGERWVLAVCWFLRWVQGWEGNIAERKRATTLKKSRKSGI